MSRNEFAEWWRNERPKKSMAGTSHDWSRIVESLGLDTRMGIDDVPDDKMPDFMAAALLFFT